MNRLSSFHAHLQQALGAADFLDAATFCPPRTASHFTVAWLLTRIEDTASELLLLIDVLEGLHAEVDDLVVRMSALFHRVTLGESMSLDNVSAILAAAGKAYPFEPPYLPTPSLILLTPADDALAYVREQALQLLPSVLTRQLLEERNCSLHTSDAYLTITTMLPAPWVGVRVAIGSLYRFEAVHPSLVWSINGGI